MKYRHGAGRAAFFLAALAISGMGWGLSGQEEGLSPPEGPEATVFRGGVAPAAVDAVRREGALSIDGRLDDPAWQPAPVITDFVQGIPVEGAEPSEPTEVRVVFDDAAIYVAARMYESDPGSIRARLTRRDERGSFDSFKLSLDPNRDGLTGYEFEVSAAGAETDRYLFGDTQEDTNWDAIWDSAVQIDARGWTVEMRIPLSQIRYEARPGMQTWGINFERRRLETNETVYFALQSRTARGRVSQFGTIDGLQLPRSSRRFEVRPFVVSQYHTAPATPGNPLFDGTEMEPRGGLDMSMGIGSAFSLDATIYPDFGQVEVDPEVINLTAFETFFPEKRPFFVRDAQIFTFAGSRGGRFGGGKALFFSRRIGREPRGSGPYDADFHEEPTQTSILGAAKLTGRTSGGLSVGALAAVTGQEMGNAYFAEGDHLIPFVAEPQAEHAVLRLQQDFRGGASKIGLIGTGLKRELPADGTFDFLPSEAFSFGVDFEHQWGGRRSRDFRLWGFYSSSLVRGSNAAMLRLQRNPNHYYQRPDAPHLAIDSTATSMFGSDWRVQLERESEHWTWGAWAGQQTPGFEINDFGFLTSGERLDVGGRISYRNIRPGNLFRNYNISLFTFHNFRHSLLEGNLRDRSNWARAHDAGSAWFSGRFTFLNNWGFNLNFSYSPQTQSDTQTRGGPLMTEPAEFGVRVDANTDRSRSFHVSPNFSYRMADQGRGHDMSTGLNISYRPLPNWRVSVNPSFNDRRDGAQYVTRTTTLSYEPTFGTRYLFGDLHRRGFSMETRLNVSFTPDLSLQLYAQPLLTSGDYVGYRQLAAAGTFDFLDHEEGRVYRFNGIVTGCTGGTTCTRDGVRHFDFDGDGELDYLTRDRDFNVRSLRGNAVFRWEYRPGSQLFLVWQHARRENVPFGSFDLNRDLEGLFFAPAENVFIVKVSHYLSI
ncbi:MAG: hypothetical protein F4Z72_05935 [Gemmatimonadales bacterium]|nr:hypothetical protein [Candidatus Palauibacter irciniicola]MYC19525.1 hypothetical protein [Gemmatimonadales bacterium]